MRDLLLLMISFGPGFRPHPLSGVFILRYTTGARLRRSVPDGQGGHIQKVYEIPREYQHKQAEKQDWTMAEGSRSLPAFH